MNPTTTTEAESFQLFLSHQLASGGSHKSPEDLVEQWRRDQQELQESVHAVREVLDNMNNGARGQTVEEVADELQRHFGWSESL